MLARGAKGRAHRPGTGRGWRRVPGLRTGRARRGTARAARPVHPRERQDQSRGRRAVWGGGGHPIILFLLPGRGSPVCELRLGQTCKRLPELRLQRAGARAPGMRNPLSVPRRSLPSPGFPQVLMTSMYLLPSLQTRSPRPFLPPPHPASCRPLLWATDSIFSLPLAFLGQIRLIVTKCWLSLEKQLNSFDYI